jgi:predicted transcriptional regulator of viral defense system
MQMHVRRDRTDDEAIAAMAGRQHGVVSRRQLLDLGISERAIHHRIRRGNLRRIHAGVYAVGHEALPFTARVAAAVLAAGAGAEVAASHWTAATVHGLCDPPHRPIDITAVNGRRPQRGIVFHRGALPADDVTFIEGLSVTTAPRTLLDLSRTVRERKIRRLFKQAEFLGIMDISGVEAVLENAKRDGGSVPRILQSARTTAPRDERDPRSAARTG